MKTKTAAGFTLYELMITVLIVGVVLAYGFPNMRAFQQNGRMSTTANDLHSSFHQARSEAARAKDNVTICASSNSTTTTPTCTGEFEDGWIVFQDTDGDIEVDAGDVILRSYPATPDGIVITAPGASDYFSFAATGLGRGNIAGKGNAVSAVLFCDERGNQTAAGGFSSARVLVVTPLGRATVLREKAQVTFHGGC